MRHLYDACDAEDIAARDAYLQTFIDAEARSMKRASRRPKAKQTALRRKVAAGAVGGPDDGQEATR